MSRWYSERFEALSPEEILQSVGNGRDYELLELERKAAEPTGRGHSLFEKLVTDIGNLRAARSLERYEVGGYSFTELLEIEDDDLLGSSESEIIEKLEGTLVAWRAPSIVIRVGLRLLSSSEVMALREAGGNLRS